MAPAGTPAPVDPVPDASPNRVPRLPTAPTTTLPPPAPVDADGAGPQLPGARRPGRAHRNPGRRPEIQPSPTRARRRRHRRRPVADHRRIARPRHCSSCRSRPTRRRASRRTSSSTTTASIRSSSNSVPTTRWSRVTAPSSNDGPGASRRHRPSTCRCSPRSTTRARAAATRSTQQPSRSSPGSSPTPRRIDAGITMAVPPSVVTSAVSSGAIDGDDPELPRRRHPARSAGDAVRRVDRRRGRTSRRVRPSAPRRRGRRGRGDRSGPGTRHLARDIGVERTGSAGPPRSRSPLPRDARRGVPHEHRRRSRTAICPRVDRFVELPLPDGGRMPALIIDEGFGAAFTVDATDDILAAGHPRGVGVPRPSPNSGCSSTALRVAERRDQRSHLIAVPGLGAFDPRLAVELERIAATTEAIRFSPASDLTSRDGARRRRARAATSRRRRSVARCRDSNGSRGGGVARGRRIDARRRRRTSAPSGLDASTVSCRPPSTTRRSRPELDELRRRGRATPRTASSRRSRSRSPSPGREGDIDIRVGNRARRAAQRRRPAHARRASSSPRVTSRSPSRPTTTRSSTCP